MQLPSIPHTSRVEAFKEPPKIILHVWAIIPEVPAEDFAVERHELLKALALHTGPRAEFDAYVIHWRKDDA